VRYLEQPNVRYAFLVAATDLLVVHQMKDAVVSLVQMEGCSDEAEAQLLQGLMVKDGEYAAVGGKDSSGWRDFVLLARTGRKPLVDIP